MQTAVEWLGFNLNAKLFDKVSPYEWEEINNLFKIALKKEHQQIKDAWDNAGIDASYGNKYKNFEHYYIENYEKTN